MYSVLIVEDEQLELMALKKVIHDKLPEISDVRTAGDGDGALELALTETPDIVLMDVHLGSVNGLDLSKLLIDEKPNIKIIVITAYDQFSYVQRALTIGVADYLLKPIPTDALEKAVRKQIRQIEKEKEMLLKEARRDRINENLNELLTTAFVGSVINNMVREKIADSLPPARYPRKSMAVFVLDFSLQIDGIQEPDIIAIKKILFDHISKNGYGTAIIGDVVNSSYLTLCLFSGDPDISFIGAAREIRNDVITNYYVPLEIGISDKTDDIFSLGAAYKQALLALKVGKGPINLYTDFVGFPETEAEIPNRLGDIINSLMDAQKDGMKAIFDTYVPDLLIREKSLSYAKVFFIRLWIGIVKEIESKISIHKEEYEGIVTETILNVMGASSIQDSMQIVLENSRLIAESIESAREKNLYHIAKRACLFIDEHFTEALTLNSLAECLRISPYYLSHAFKDINGASFSEYLNRKRIGAAKVLLEGTSKSVMEVAYEVGYMDSNYFCRVFKKSTNLTPSNYRAISRG